MEETAIKLADTGKRIIAFLLDNLAAFLIWIIIWIPLEIIFPPFLEKIIQQPTLIIRLASIIPPILYFLVKDGLSNGQSIGKKLMGLRTVDYNDKTKQCSISQSIVRNLFLLLFYLIPLIWIAFLYQISVKEKRRFGDGVAKTIVIGK